MQETQVGDADSIPGLGGSPGGENDYALLYSCLENPMYRGADGLQSIGLQSWTRLSMLHKTCSIITFIP